MMKIFATKSSMMEVSYWFRDNDKTRAFLTTEEHPEIDNFPVNKNSAIGCAFSYPDHIARWEAPKNFIARWLAEGYDTTVFNFKGEEEKSLKCQTADRKAKPILAIACASYNRHDNVESNYKYTVGICVFSGSADTNIFMSGYSKFLEERVREFDQYMHDLIEKGKVTALLSDKEGKLSPIMATK